ncbi:hypothetical protein HDV00_004238 [Rhizophlyctis rosea]|nr:hypothetical protein HDV00_004238 [Rhizophlyctis rosea]
MGWVFQFKQDIASCLAAFAALTVYLNNLRAANTNHQIDLGLNPNLDFADLKAKKSSLYAVDPNLWKLYVAALITELIAAIIFCILAHFFLRSCCGNTTAEKAETQEKEYVVGHTSAWAIFHVIFRSASFTYDPETCRLPDFVKMVITVFFKATVSVLILVFYPWLFGLEFVGGLPQIINVLLASLADIATSIVAEARNEADGVVDSMDAAKSDLF